MNNEIPELTNGKFDDFVQENFVLIDFFAEWCGPCVLMAPVVEELNEKFSGKIKFGKVNVGENQELAKKFDISSIPNFTLFKDGEIVEQFIGGMSREDFEEKLNEFIQ